MSASTFGSTRGGLAALPAVVLMLAGAATGVRTAGAQAEISPTVLDQVKGATVYVKLDLGERGGTGSGFLIRAQDKVGLIVTNAHVVTPGPDLEDDEPGRPFPGDTAAPAPGPEPAPKADPKATPKPGTKPDPKAADIPPPPTPGLSVVFRSGTAKEKEYPATIVALDHGRDLAVLRFTLPAFTGDFPKPIDPLRKVPARETMKVYMLGFPYGAAIAGGAGAAERNPAITVGTGTVSSIRNDAAGRPEAVQIDGSLNPGNSGGPVVDTQGRLVGITVAGIRGSGIGFAIPPAHLDEILAGGIGAPLAKLRRVAGGTAEVDLALPVWDPLGRGKPRELTISYAPVPDNWEKPKADKAGVWPLAATSMIKVPLVWSGDRPYATAVIRLNGASGAKVRYALQGGYKGLTGKVVVGEPTSGVVDFTDGAEKPKPRPRLAFRPGARPGDPPMVVIVPPDEPGPMPKADPTRPIQPRPPVPPGVGPVPTPPTGGVIGFNLPEVHPGGILAVAYCEDNMRAAALGADNRVSMLDRVASDYTAWDKESVRFRGARVTSFDWRKDVAAITAVAEDGMIMTVDRPAGAGGNHRLHINGISAIAFSKDGKTCAVAYLAEEDGRIKPIVRLMNMPGFDSPRQFAGPESKVGCIAFSPDGRHLAVGLDRNTMRIWDIVEKKDVRTIVYPGEALTTCIAWNHDGSLIAWGNDQGSLALADFKTGKSVYGIKQAHEGVLHAVAFSKCGGTLASAGADKRISFWETDRRVNEPICDLEGHRAAVRALAFSPDGREMLSGDAAGHIVKWNLTGRKK